MPFPLHFPHESILLASIKKTGLISTSPYHSPDPLRILQWLVRISQRPITHSSADFSNLLQWPLLPEIRKLSLFPGRPSKSVLRVLHVLGCASCASLCFPRPLPGSLLRPLPEILCASFCASCASCASRVLRLVLGQKEARASRAPCFAVCFACFDIPSLR